MKEKKKFKTGIFIFLVALMVSSLVACGIKDESATSSSAMQSYSNILIAYFSRWGNTDYPTDIDASTSASVVIDKECFGTTEYVAQMIQQTIGGDFFPETV